jgi:pyruvate,water dikinase
MTEAVDGLIALARIAQRHPVLRAQLVSTAAAATAANLDALEPLEGGPEFGRAVRALLEPERQGLRCGASWGVEQNQCLPGWREAPALVLQLVQRYLPLDLDALERSHAAVVAQRDARVETIRGTIVDGEQRRQFDFWLTAGRRAVQAQEDHNYHIDSATNALLHRAIAECGRRLAGAGAITRADDVWWLREHEVLAAVRGLGDAADAAVATAESTPSHWTALVEAHKALHAWQRSLRAPAWLGAPAVPKPAPAGAASTPNGSSQGVGANANAAPDPLPPALLVKGQPAAAGVRTGLVRVLRHDAPDADAPALGPDAVLVARQAGALWGPLAPATAAVVLEVGSPFMHIMAVCREYGVPGVVNAKGATVSLQDGQRVIVDGTNGWVLAAE